MKLAITKTNFPFGVKAAAINGGFRVAWLPSKSEPIPPGIDFTEAYVRERCGRREISEATNIYIEMDSSGSITRVHNKMASTLTEKSNGYEYALKNGTLVAAQIYIPLPDSPVADWVLRVNGNPSIMVEMPDNTIEVVNSLQASHDFAKSLYPSIQIIDIQNVGSDCFDVTTQLVLGSEPLRKAGVRLFATSAAGYINKREIYTDTQGQASIKARRLDLESNDDMRVEFGFKFTKNICHADIPKP